MAKNKTHSEFVRSDSVALEVYTNGTCLAFVVLREGWSRERRLLSSRTSQNRNRELPG